MATQPLAGDVGEQMRSTDAWVRGPVGLEADRRVTRRGCRTVLVMVPTMTAGTRLMDLVPLLEADFRVQVVFTVPHAGESWHGLDDYVRGTGGMVVPWDQAVRHPWDLVLTASHRHIEQVHGKVLVLPHGAGAVMSRRYSRKAGAPTRPTTGLDRELLTYRGRVIPSAVVLTHEDELRTLRETCPEALPAAVVAGDICLDRMVASLPFREQYRQALGLDEDQTLITVSSTWSAESTFGCHPDLYTRLTGEAGDRVRVAAVLHPNVWAAHGRRQVHSWLAHAERRGLLIIPPEEGWRAVMIASDYVIGDHGSTTSYAAAIGRPTHLATYPARNIGEGTVAAVVARTAPLLRHDQPVLPQIREIRAQRSAVAAKLSSRPNAAASVLRTTMYRLLGVPEPSWPPPISPVPAYRPAVWR